MAKAVYIGVSSKAVQLTNIAPTINGNSGWSAGTSSTSVVKYGSASLCLTGTTSTGEVTAHHSTKIPLISSHTYYVSYWYYKTVAAPSTNAYWPIAEPAFATQTVSTVNAWVRYGDVKSRSTFEDGTYEMRVDFNNVNLAGSMYFDGLMLIDLTAAFGAGNEPDATWCNANIPYFTGITKVEYPLETSVARKVKKMYIGVDGVAHKVKKAYIGVDGVARLFWSGGGGELSYYGTATSLSDARYQLAATTVGGYALFGGGFVSSSTVDAYNSSLTRTSPTELSSPRGNLSATTVGNYALFGSGSTSAAGSYYGGVDAYDTSLTMSTYLGVTPRDRLAATTVGEYALFGGGTNSGYYYNTVDAFNSSFTASTPSALSASRYHLSAATVGNYALFGGGVMTSYYNTVDAYNSSLTRSTPTSLSAGRYALAAASVGNYALFAGGCASDESAVVDAYNASLTRSTPTALSVARHYLAATSAGDYALFGGGYCTSGYYDTVDAYDTSLTRTTPTTLSANRYGLAATAIGDYALFGGGLGGSSGYSAVVDAYLVS